jgi:hypothetical protein
MNRKTSSSLAVCGVLVVAIVAASSASVGAQGDQPLAPAAASQPDAAAAQIGTAFTYQGQLKKGGSAFNGACSFEFKLFDAETGGAQRGSTVAVNNVNVANGLFTAQLDFGDEFQGEARWLGMAVKCASDAGFQQFDKRMPLAASPYALSLRPGAVIVNTNGDALTGRSVNGSGVDGFSTNWFGVYGESVNNEGVYGTSVAGSGVVGLSTNRIGVYGESKNFEGVRGVSYNIDHAAIVGVHEGGGWGMYGLSKGNGVVGESTNGAVGVFGRSSGGTAGTGVWGESTTGAGVVGKNTGNWVGVYGESNTNTGVWGVSASGAGVAGKSTSGNGVWAESASPTNSALYAKNTGGGRAAFFDGTARTRIFEIIGGADLAERFNLSIQAEPGTLLIIDEANAGQLMPSIVAYDAKVAGIVSGAGGVNPGLTLHQEGVLEGDTEVAIAGRVYVKATAANGAIKPGDLLTTSDVPGYAMKATDRERASGAVIGKAMTGLDGGTGLVLVLVNLQ